MFTIPLRVAPPLPPKTTPGPGPYLCRNAGCAVGKALKPGRANKNYFEVFCSDCCKGLDAKARKDGVFRYQCLAHATPGSYPDTADALGGLDPDHAPDPVAPAPTVPPQSSQAAPGSSTSLPTPASSQLVPAQDRGSTHHWRGLAQPISEAWQRSATAADMAYHSGSSQKEEMRRLNDKDAKSITIIVWYSVRFILSA
jgi:hypothetical protein